MAIDGEFRGEITMQKKYGWVPLLLLILIIQSQAVQSEENLSADHRERVSLSGQVRTRFDATNNQSLEDFSYNPAKRETQLLNRSRIHVVAHPAEWVGFYFEPQFYGRWGGYDNENQLSLYQGYIEFLKGGKIPVTLKIGRQELVYGSAFFLGNDDFYQGLSWDGAKINIQPLSSLTVDLIAARLVSFTNNKANKPGLYGFYSTYTGLPDINWDVYFFYDRHGFQNLYDHLPASPLWFTAGTRIELKLAQPLTVEFEPMYQFGRVRFNGLAGSNQIRTYGGHAHLTYDFNLPLYPSLRVCYAFGTGDRNTQDGTMREFHGNIYNDIAVVGDMNIIPDMSGVDIGEIRASGIRATTLASSIKLNPRLTISFDYHYFVADKTPKGFSTTLGNEIDFYIEYEVSDKISILGSVNRFFTADIFRQATGKNKDIDYFFLQTQIEF